MKKVLFIDRDGTLIIEPEDEQIDCFEKLEFYPGVFQYLSRIAGELDYELVMVSNQDGLGTSSFPEETFWPVQNMILKTFENEGVRFSDILLDRSFPEDNLPTRKPGTAMLTHYLKGDYDLENSYVIGDRLTDVQLADNMGCKSILISSTLSEKATLTTTEWEEIYRFLKSQPRIGSVTRKTSETDISIKINIDGKGKSEISTGLGFFDHMLEQIARHANADLSIIVKGDLHIDEHHTIEDVGIALGDAFLQALGKKKGVERISSTFNSKLLSSGILIIFTLFILADTSYIPYVGGQMITLSFCGSQKILKTKSMISSLPFPIQILSTDIPFILERDFLRVRWCGSGYLFLFPNGFSLASRNIPSSPQNSSRALE
jgi:imidazoleglycerol-phosphate dehydratase/histidinol-phosphatase